jgi:hypothetical protein
MPTTLDRRLSLRMIDLLSRFGPLVAVTRLSPSLGRGIGVAEVFAVAELWLATVLGLGGVWDDQCRASYRADR